MASTNVCRLDSRSSVNLFTAIGLICNFLVENIFIILRLFVCNFNGPLESQLAVNDDQMLTSHVCKKCTLGLVALEKAEIDLHAFKQQALSSLIALQSS